MTREAIDAYLRSQKCVLFGRHYDINNDESRADCVEFLYKIFMAINEDDQ